MIISDAKNRNANIKARLHHPAGRDGAVEPERGDGVGDVVGTEWPGRAVLVLGREGSGAHLLQRALEDIAELLELAHDRSGLRVLLWLHFRSSFASGIAWLPGDCLGHGRFSV